MEYIEEMPTLCSSPTPSAALSDSLIAAVFEDVLEHDILSRDKPGDRIGPYQLIESIGEGGFGVVWKAKQLSEPERLVAVKLIKPGMDSREVLTRFDQERQVLASLVHPHIATMLESALTPDGRPCFVMELVHGQSITSYARRHQLGLPERLELFIKVCHGVQYAHQKGIIHRDLKPSNILVTEVAGQPVPKIIDFGVAKALHWNYRDPLPSSITRAHVSLGSPLYMSPEQMTDASSVDTRSDIYALGVLLYELLTGQPPFDSATLAQSTVSEARQLICNTIPPAPSRNLTRQATADQLPADLDWITLCALEKQASRRYPTATEFAADVQRFLRHKPVAARPPTLAYQLSCWVQRNPFGLILSLVALAVLALGFSAMLNQARHAKQQAFIASQASEASAQDKAWLSELEQLQRLSEQGLRSDVPAKLEALLTSMEQQGDSGSPTWLLVQRELTRTWLKLGNADAALKASERARTPR